MRHGQTEKNQAKLLQGRSNFPLNETGIKEAQEAGKWFREQGIVFDAVYASPLIRAVQTAEIAAGVTSAATKEDEGKSGKTEVIRDDRLLEMDYGPYEGMDLSNPAPEIITFFSDFVHNPVPEGMEKLSSVVGRLGDFLNDLPKTDGNVLIATHAVAMKGALEYLTPESGGSYWSKYIGTCGVYMTESTDTGFTIPVEVYSQGGIKEGV